MSYNIPQSGGSSSIVDDIIETNIKLDEFTINNTPKTISSFSYPIEVNSAYVFEIKWRALQQNINNFAHGFFVNAIRRNAGAAVRVTTSGSTPYSQSDFTGGIPSILLKLNGNNAEIEVTGKTGFSIDWKIEILIRKNSLPI